MTFAGSYLPPMTAKYAIAWRMVDDTEYSKKGSAPLGYKTWSASEEQKTGCAARSPGP